MRSAVARARKAAKMADAGDQSKIVFLCSVCSLLKLLGKTFEGASMYCNATNLLGQTFGSP